MFPMIDQGISKVLDAAMKKGDFETFRTTFEAEGLDASGLLYSRARKNAWPLVKRALDDPFKKTTVGGKLDIARYLMGKGADLNVSAPWGILFVGGLSELVAGWIEGTLETDPAELVDAATRAFTRLAHR